MSLLKQVMLRPKLSILFASLLFLAAIGGIRGALSSSSSKPTQKPIASPSPVSVQAAKETCGDPPDDSANDWYPVFIDGGNLAEIQAKFCKDAITKTREKTGKATVQLASFSDRSRAENFAKSVSGEVGESYSVASAKKVEEDPVTMPEAKIATPKTPSQEFVDTLSGETEGLLATDQVKVLAPTYYQNRQELWIAISGIPATKAVSLVEASLKNLAIERGINYWDDEKISKMAVGIVRGMYRWNRENPGDLAGEQIESTPEPSSGNSSETVTAQVIDPPSNCRASGKKDSEVVTVFKDKQSIEISPYSLVGGWHFVRKESCYIHKSQISF